MASLLGWSGLNVLVALVSYFAHCLGTDSGIRKVVSASSTPQ